jgi:hypothetical protein
MDHGGEGEQKHSLSYQNPPWVEHLPDAPHGLSLLSNQMLSDAKKRRASVKESCLVALYRWDPGAPHPHKDVSYNRHNREQSCSLDVEVVELLGFLIGKARPRVVSHRYSSD